MREAKFATKTTPTPLGAYLSKSRLLGNRSLPQTTCANNSASSSRFPRIEKHASVAASEGAMRPKNHETTGSGDLFAARLDQIIKMRHELVQLAGKIDWEFIDGEIAPLYSDGGRPGIATQFVIGLFLLKHIYGLSDEGVCERWVYDPYFQHFTGEEFLQHEF